MTTSQFTITALIYDLGCLHEAARAGHDEVVLHEWRRVVARSAFEARRRILVHAARALRDDERLARALRRIALGRDRRTHNRPRVSQSRIAAAL